uniref:Uncharacterized protein n=1 Tax=Phakopsora pachyrhizi TaxID=170000 RepID=A0A0S1MJ11_PHAPC
MIFSSSQIDSMNSTWILRDDSSWLIQALAFFVEFVASRIPTVPSSLSNHWIKSFNAMAAASCLFFNASVLWISKNVWGRFKPASLRR